MHRPKHHLIQSVAKSALIISSCSTMLYTSTAVAEAVHSAQTAVQQREYSIAAGSLDNVLTRFASESGIFIALNGNLTSNQSSRGLKGQYTLDGALQQILSGTGLIAKRQEHNRYILQQVSTDTALMMLDPIMVSAAPGTRTEDADDWRADWMRSAGGMQLTQRETPQSTSIVTDSQLKDRNLYDVSDVMDTTTGVTSTPSDSERVKYFSRGFYIDSYQYDGVPAPSDSTYQFGDNNADMVLYDHIEVVRGANGLMQGAGNPGASINFVRKRPTDYLRRELAVGVSSPAGARFEGDIAGPLNKSGSLRGRLVAAYDDRDTTLDRYHKERQTLFGTLEYDISKNTLINVGISRQETDADAISWGGLIPWDSEYRLIDWSHSTNLAPGWTYNNTQRTETYASLEHVFDNDWTGRIVTTHLNNEYQSRLMWATGDIDRKTGSGLTYEVTDYDNSYTQNSLNATLTGDADWFGRNHEFVVGAMYSKDNFDFDRFDPTYDTADGRGVIDNAYTWDEGSQPPSQTGTPTQFRSKETTQIGTYATARFSVSEPFHIITGVRLNWWEGDNTSTNRPYFSYSYDAIVTPYLGATYDLSDTLTAYGSATSIYQPQLYQDLAGNYLDPAYGYNYELGLKADLFDSAMYASAAIFHTDQKDVTDQLYYDDELGRSVYDTIDGTTTQGFEIEAAGSINDHWKASLGYTYRTSEDHTGAEIYTDRPKHTVKLATNYRLPNILDEKLTIGGGLRWQSKTDSIPWEGDAPNLVQDAYSVVDFDAKYDFNYDTTLTLSVKNLFDKEYYASTGFYNRVIFGDGRTAEIVVRSKF
ncbi:Ferric-pseudobactin BN7/BN8 receptor precursor [Marinomonas gallaica]|uniref:Ferric-pseudobactin BN7/BN8 receptor n=1 Tax=Marinomonas gallaica TaxID=1806667 RepID=A0A1C3JTS3_9GAMM|nr:TonB-dependent receptor [Marinomonas gallaica]SBT18527.1 Ferric-pseudobactin BN7/BN8 receptor precursor [Marinomonas gallaica]SBT22764.1 Ferric-pseudobactin BN7/BN8 receptor precursor [Marinomonas gallaica]